ncbi:MAG: methyltransferase domain-containing protein [Candidatus Sericytochromatia bacterium]|nr:methyltransferase domain-containing protein [Candidatus Tanganyikabacteria bacterium]
MTCPLCRSDGAREILSIPDPLAAARRFDLLRCAACRHVYVSPVPADLGAYYPGTYWSGDRPATLASRAEAAYRAALLALDVRRIASHAPRGARVLDVGCGSGDLAASLARAGFAVTGVEVAPDAAEAARRRHGLDVRTGTLAAADFPAGSFDVAVVWHVLEHVPDPAGLLADVARVLRPGGVAIVQVPNFGSIQAGVFGARWFALDVPRHLHHFTPATLARTLEAAGFQAGAVKHGSLRHDPVILASSLWPALGPHAMERAGAAAKAAYLGLTWLAAPLTLVERACRRGAVITIAGSRPVRAEVQ